MPSRRSLEIWHLVIDNLIANEVSPLFSPLFFWEFLLLGYGLVFSYSRSFVIFQMSLNPWARCEGYAECEWALELNGHQVLFECGHRRYWYLGDRVWPQVQHEYPPTTIPIPPCPSIRLANFLVDEKIAWAHDDYIVAGVEGDYTEFIRTHL